jgi:tetratricopeptide (TPR) repeat protein
VPPQELPEGRTTDNMEAYNAYLRGRKYFDSRVGDWKEEAGAAFDRAIELDPGFAPPYAGKATLVVNSSTGPHWEEARDLALKSLELDPELPLGHAALGLTLAVLGDNERGIESLRRAIELDPALAIAYTWITLPLHRIGLHEEARAMMERGLEIDPLSPVLIRNLADSESAQGNLDRAEKLLLRLAGLPEPPVWTHDMLWDVYTEWGRYANAADIAKNESRLSANRDGDLRVVNLAHTYALLGLDEHAHYWMEVFRSRWEDSDPPMHESYYFVTEGVGLRGLSADLQIAESLVSGDDATDVPYLLSYGGLAWIQLGDVDKGIDWVERGISLYQQNMVPDDPPEGIDYALLDRNWSTEFVVYLAQRLAFAYRSTGNESGADKAVGYLEQAEPFLTLRSSPYYLEVRAMTRVLVGDTEGALDYLRQAAAAGWANYYRIANDPAWDETLEIPEFQAVLAEAKANNDRQRAIVEAADAEQDFRAEFEHLLLQHSRETP